MSNKLPVHQHPDFECVPAPEVLRASDEERNQWVRDPMTLDYYRRKHDGKES